MIHLLLCFKLQPTFLDRLIAVSIRPGRYKDSASTGAASSSSVLPPRGSFVVMDFSSPKAPPLEARALPVVMDGLDRLPKTALSTLSTIKAGSANKRQPATVLIVL